MIPASHSLKTARAQAFAFLLIAMTFTGQSVRASAGEFPGDVPKDETHGKGAPLHLEQEIELAGDYLLGKGVPRDPKQSAYWYRKAADQGDPGAQNEIGYFYLTGIGVPRDEAQAAKWFERSAAAGSARGKLNLAVMYLKGAGVRKDSELGMKMLNDLAAKDDPLAETYLGMICYLGGCAGKDSASAEKWFLSAAKHHQPEAEYCMGTLYSETADHPHDLPRAAEYLRASATGGYVPGMYSLGLLLTNHPEIPQRPGEAVQVLESAANAGIWRSAVVLGIFSRDGSQGFEKDAASAYRWFVIAEQQGGAEARQYLKTDVDKLKNGFSPDMVNQQNEIAAEWIQQHPHRDLFLFGAGRQRAYFPLAEVYAVGSGADELSEGAMITGSK